MPIERADLYQTSILRKYLCYAPPRLFLFADRPILFAPDTPFFDYRWRDGEGKEHTLFE